MAQVLTGRNSRCAERIIELLQAFVDDSTFTDPYPAIKRVYYGDQSKFPDVPAICVEPGTKRRDWPPTPTDMTEIRLEVMILIYFTAGNTGMEGVEGGPEYVRRATDHISEAIEEYLNTQLRLTDANGDDLVIYGYVTQN